MVAAAPPPALLKPAALHAKAPATYNVAFATTKGRFVVTVHRAWAPRGADRFYNLVRARFFDGVEFFRIVKGFVVQFGISRYPSVSSAWQTATIKDDPVKTTNARATITFADSGPNSRTTQVFINLARNSQLDGYGFAPFGRVTTGMSVVDKIYGGYGEAPSNAQPQIAAQGNTFLKKRFPKLDAIVTARIVKR
ncbi:MAG TPA: peptidylprolyl isomerase [Gaiellaceae bacterium]|nr:peptidylprolyl isomerase [Gaiellaceae bacterium]